MASEFTRPPLTPEGIKALLLVAAPLLLPSIGPHLAWLHTLVPLSVAYHLVVLGGRRGNVLVVQAMLLAGLAALLAQSMVVYLFGISMVPLGYILARGFSRNLDPSQVGLQALGYLMAVWLLLGAYAGISGGPTPLEMAQESIGRGMATALDQGGEAGLSEPELEAALAVLLNFVERTWVALFTVSLLTLVWLNIMAGHWLLNLRGLSPWPGLRYWRLPDQLVALAAVVLLLLILRLEPGATFGLNGVIVLGMLYFMQGLGVMSCLLAHWNVPPLLRGICYALVLLQGYGLLLLALLGLAEVRLNLRRRYAAGQ